jgi:hypothetical protein
MPLTTEELAEQEKLKKKEEEEKKKSGLTEVDQFSKEDLMRMVRGQKQLMGNLRGELATLKEEVTSVKEKSEEVKVDPTESASEFYKNPEARIDKMLDAKLNDAIAPLKSFADEFRGERATNRTYPRLKAELKAQIPVLRDNKHFEEVIDSYVADGSIDLSNPDTAEDVLRKSMMGALGMASMGEITIRGITPGVPLEESNSEDKKEDIMSKGEDGLTGKDRITPPHFPSSGHPSGVGDGNQDDKLPSDNEILASMDENARRLWKESGMTLQEHYQWGNIDPEEVATSMIGITEDKKDA